jgi:membrane protease YdiL (CAAX protease family)
MNVFPHFPTYPFSRLTLLLLYAYVVLLIPALRRTVGWLRLGKLNAKMGLLILAMVILEVVGVRGWVRENSPDLSRYTGMVPDLPFGLLMVYGVGFAAFNAALEEITCRGVMMEALDSAFGAGYWSVLIQAVAFGAAHYGGGFPNGVQGSGMTFGYALVLGFIRRKTRGMLGCWIVHFFGDAAVFCSILFFIHHSGE